jgi:hypothetical protein
MTETGRERDMLPVCSLQPGQCETHQLMDSLPGQLIHDYTIHASQIHDTIRLRASSGEFGSLE